jgi:predicted nucleic acid-binding Zn ribbon protein
MNYTYKCHGCKSVFLKVMSFEEFDKEKNKKSKCVHCGKKTATRIIQSSPKIEFVGDGFYINDSKMDEHKTMRIDKL